jgi:membrane protease YdiL (CAAX protease family)
MKRPSRRTLVFQWLGDVALCLLVAVPLSLPAAVTLKSRPERGAYPVSWAFWASMLAIICGMAAVAFFRLSRMRRAGVLLIGLSSMPARGLWRLLLLACAAVPLLRLMQAALIRVLDIGPGSDPIAAALSQTRGWALCPAIAALVLAGPISEELLFRGLLLGRFRANGYLVSGTIISTVIFMLSHSDPRQYLELCGGGLLLAWLYHRTNSLWPPIALHALVNAWYAIQTVFSARS